MRPLRYTGWWLAAGVVLVAIVVAGSLAPSRGVDLSGGDKMLHLIAYLGLALWFGGVYRPARYPLVATALIALGLVLEVIQSHVGRSMEVADMVANAAGVLGGIGLSRLAPGSWCQWVEARLAGSG